MTLWKGMAESMQSCSVPSTQHFLALVQYLQQDILNYEINPRETLKEV